MAVFIELVTDAFEEVFREQSRAHQNSGGGSRSSRAGKTVVRRPTRGIEIKDDTYAYLKVIMSNGVELPLLDSSSYTGTNAKGYTNFILQSVNEQRMEKHQIVETFGDAYVFFFGESPRFLDCSAILINTHDFNWRAEWWHNYEHYLRGTKLVELGARCYMFWDDNVIEGYMLMSSASEVAEQPYTVSLQFRFFVTKYQSINLSSVEQFPVRSSVQLPPGVELTQSDAFDKLQAFYRGGSAGTRGSDAVSREQFVVGDALSSGGSGVGPLAGNAPVATRFGPSTYAFGGASASAGISAGFGAGVGAGFGASATAGIGFGASAGASASFGASASAGAGFGASASAGVGFGASASASVGVGVGTSLSLGLGTASGPLGAPRVGPGFGRQSGEAYAPFQKITQKIRELPPSVVVDPSIWNALRGTTGLASVEDQNVLTVDESTRGGALRGLIAENIDEYVNGTDGYPGIRAYMQGATESYIEPYYALGKAITRAQELSFGLPYSVVTTLNALGIAADNPYAMRALGLAPNFSPGYIASAGAFASVGVSAGFGASASLSAGVGASTSFGGASSYNVSYSPLANASLGGSAGIGVSARAGYFANATGGSSYLATAGGYSYTDPLGAIYGRNNTQVGFSPDTHRYVEGTGFPSYGYNSPYGGVGYGRAGFGDFGGAGFGAGNALGDPGFRDPFSVTVRGTSSVSRVRYDATALTPGPMLGGTAVLGGASVSVGGVSSAFSMTAFSGSFNPWVVAASKQQPPIYGQPAVGPGSPGVYGPNLGYAAYQQNQFPVSQPYVGGVTVRASASASFGFF